MAQQLLFSESQQQESQELDDGLKTPESQISRSWSSSSSSSGVLSRGSSSASYKRRFSFGDSDEDESQPKPTKKRQAKQKKTRKRKSADPQLAADVKRVTIPVLQALDSQYLAPLNSPLFRRMFKRTKNANGKRELKKNPDIVIKLFKRLVRPVLRSILGNAAVEDRSLLGRYYHAALRVVKKRRANHVQAWRLQARHKPLIYDDSNIYAESLAIRARNANRDDDNYSTAACCSDTTVEYDAAADAGPGSGVSDVEEGGVCAGAAEDDVGDNNVNTAPRPPCDITPASGNCVDCGEAVQCNSFKARPNPIRCSICLDKFVKKKYVNMVHEGRPSGDKERENIRAERDANGKKIRQRRTSCKWCGSTTHLSRSSRQCPHNKKNQAAAGESANTVAAAAAAAAAATADANKAQRELAAFRARSDRKAREIMRFHNHYYAARKSVDAADAPRSYTAPTPTPTTPDTDIDSDGVSRPPCVPITPPEVPHSDDAETASITPPPDRQRFQVGDNVIAKWKGRQHFLAHVTGFEDGKYTVYFLDHHVKEGLTEKDLREYDGSYHTRADMLGKCFEDEGDSKFAAGRFRVVGIEGNEYVCIRVSGAGEGQKTNFQIGHVIHTYEESEQKKRERGVGQVLSGKRRRRGVGQVLSGKRSRV